MAPSGHPITTGNGPGLTARPLARSSDSITHMTIT